MAALGFAMTENILYYGKAAAMGGGAAAVVGGSTVVAQSLPSAASPPSQSGQTFRAYVRFATGASVQTLKLLPIAPRQVVVRTEAAQICSTTTPQGLGGGDATQAVIPCHGGVGTVVEAGSSVDRVQVGDRVIDAGQAQCGACGPRFAQSRQGGEHQRRPLRGAIAYLLSTGLS